MTPYDRAARALCVLRADIDAGAPNDHRSTALGALLELWAAGAADLWVRIAVAELWSGRLNPGELRALVDDCLHRATAALAAEQVPRPRTTMLPPPSIDGLDEQRECDAARASLPAVDPDATEPYADGDPAYSTVPASAAWFEVEEGRAMCSGRAMRMGGLRL
jgi:hypothetical protein